MKHYGKLLRQVRRQWILERSARRMLQVLAWSANTAILLLLLLRVFNLPVLAMAVVPVAALIALVMILWRARARAPRGRRLLQLLDERAGTADLFASAWEFDEAPERFGWMGRLTCRLARTESERAAPRGHWTLGTLRQWTPALATAGILLCLYLGVRSIRSSAEVEREREMAAIEKISGTGRQSSLPREKQAPEQTVSKTEETDKHAAVEDDFAPAEPEVPDEDIVQITDEMIEKYMDEADTQQEIDLEGVSPIRWDEEEIEEAGNPKEGDIENEKIDPVKLDAELLKDLQAAKKTKLEGEGGGEDKGVDVAVMGKEKGRGKPKSDRGGKNEKGALAGAVTKDPRGKPTRLAMKLTKKGLSIRSAMRAPQQQKEKGQDRPMGILEFLAAVRNTRSRYKDAAEKPTSGVAVHTEDRVIRQEHVTEEAAQVTERYFDELRRADR